MTDGIFGGVGLAAQRLRFGPQTLVTVSHDHIAVRTPSRPEWGDGNALHLLREPAEVQPWIERFRTTVASIAGIRAINVCWEVAGGGAPRLPDVPDGYRIETFQVHRITDPGPPALDADDVGPAGDDPLRWAGARALLLQTGDGAWADWRSEQERALVTAGRGHVWLAYRYGVPAVRGALWHDRAGLGVVADVITHPLHRGAGLARALVAGMAASHRAIDPDGQILAVTDRPGLAGDGLAQVATICRLTDA